jgi:hypothetical protein
MSKLNLTKKQQEILRQLVALDSETEDQQFFVSGEITSPTRIWGHSTTGRRIAASTTDLQMLEQEGMIRMNWNGMGGGVGSVCQRGHEAVANDFNAPEPLRPVHQFVQNYGSMGHVQLSGIGNNSITQNAEIGEVVAALTRATAELTAALNAALSPEDAAAATADARAVSKQLEADKPDPDLVAKKTRSMWTRISDGLGTGAEFMGKADKVAGAVTRFGPWLVTAWHLLRLKSGH